MTEINTYKFNAGIEQPLRLAVVADLHGGKYKELLEELSALSPDALLCPGDTLHAPVADDRGLDFLRDASLRFPTFCSVGNHEVKHGDARGAIRSTGAILLDDSYEKLMGINIGGLTSGYAQDPIQGRLKQTPAPNLGALKEFFGSEGFKILLCHHPEYFDRYLADSKADLIVSGHAHGGQWRILKQGIFAPGQGIFPKYTSGLYRKKLLVSRGLANNLFIPRIFNKPELIIIELK